MTATVSQPKGLSSLLKMRTMGDDAPRERSEGVVLSATMDDEDVLGPSKALSAILVDANRSDGAYVWSGSVESAQSAKIDDGWSTDAANSADCASPAIVQAGW